MRLQREQSFERRIGPVALVAIADCRLFAGLFPCLLVKESLRGLHRRDLATEKTFLLRARSALLAFERIFVLCLPADLVTLGHDLGGVAHHHV